MKRFSFRSAMLWLSIAAVPAVAGTAYGVVRQGPAAAGSAPDNGSSAALSQSQLDALERRKTDPFVGVAAGNGSGVVVGFRQNHARWHGGNPPPVYKNSDGTGGVVGYLTDFGFVEKSVFDAPGFDIAAARAAHRAELEAESRKADPNFNLDKLEKELFDKTFEQAGVVPPVP